jgi:polyisoprenyl-phosphate glycosyltransferase
MSDKKKISVILPTLNECENVQLMYDALMVEFVTTEIDYEIIFVDDNSYDGTIDKVKALSSIDDNVKYLIMSKRFGDQVCLMAGLDYASGDAVIIMDSDLQHPPKYIPAMISKWREGADVVIMQRENAGHSSRLKKNLEIVFYKFLNWISDENIYFRFSGFSLLDKKVVSNIKKFKEYEPFLRGIISLVGFNHATLSYIEDERKTGATKYSLIKQAGLALIGITSFSNKLLYLSFYIGLLSVFSTFVYAVFILINKILYVNTVIDGWTSVILLIIFFGGIQLITVGILGIYVGKNFIESKRRPRYIVNEFGGVIK